MFAGNDRFSYTQNFLHAPNLPALQTDLDAMWVRGRLGQNVFNDAFCKLAAALILLHNNANIQARFDVGAFCIIHDFYFLKVHYLGLLTVALANTLLSFLFSQEGQFQILSSFESIISGGK